MSNQNNIYKSPVGNVFDFDMSYVTTEQSYVRL